MQWWRRQPPERIDQDWEVVDDSEDDDTVLVDAGDRVATSVLASPLLATACLSAAQQACRMGHADWRIQLALTVAVYLARSRRPAVQTMMAAFLLSSTFSGKRA